MSYFTYRTGASFGGCCGAGPDGIGGLIGFGETAQVLSPAVSQQAQQIAAATREKLKADCQQLATQYSVQWNESAGRCEPKTVSGGAVGTFAEKLLANTKIQVSCTTHGGVYDKVNHTCRAPLPAEIQARLVDLPGDAAAREQQCRTWQQQGIKVIWDPTLQQCLDVRSPAEQQADAARLPGGGGLFSSLVPPDGSFPWGAVAFAALVGTGLTLAGYKLMQMAGRPSRPAVAR